MSPIIDLLLVIKVACDLIFLFVFIYSRYYPFHYAPYMTDIKNFSDMKIEFEMGNPFMPFEQLLAVLPAASRKLLPEPFQVCFRNNTGDCLCLKKYGITLLLTHLSKNEITLVFTYVLKYGIALVFIYFSKYVITLMFFMSQSME